MATLLKIHLLCFGRTAEITGARSIDLEVNATTVGALRKELSVHFPALSMANFSIAVDRVHALDHDAVHDGSEVALIPPVSGG